MARFVVIDDNPAGLELMRFLLASHGHEVLAHGDGAAGLAAVHLAAPDAVLCDIQLPGLSGWEFARQLRAEPRFARLPLVAITAHAMRGDRERVLSAGFDGYIDKPIQPGKFVAQAEAFLPAALRLATSASQAGRRS